ncbi:MAG: cell wall hydrolase [Alphaproteobacteria bacterium]
MEEVKQKKQENEENKDWQVLAKTIYGMSHNDSLKMMEAMACVAINRVKKSSSNTKLTTICMDSKLFSCWDKHSYDYFLLNNIPKDDKAFDICKRISLKKLHNAVDDITKGATIFHDVFEYPLWARGKAPCLEIGDKLFYNNID